MTGLIIEQIVETKARTFSPTGVESYSDEQVIIRNTGSWVADLSGWTLDANGPGQQLVFPEGTEVAPGGQVAVWTFKAEQDLGNNEFTFGRKVAVWRNDGDIGKLFDAEGGLRSVVAYGDKEGEAAAFVGDIVEQEPPPVEWASARSGGVPRGAVRGGNESNGAALYIARAAVGDAVVPGKVRAAFRAMNFGWGGRESKANPYEVLVNTSVAWKPGSSGAVPEGAIEAGHDGQGGALYVCRSYYARGWHTGSYSVTKGASIGYGGREVRVSRFDVLCRG